MARVFILSHQKETKTFSFSLCFALACFFSIVTIIELHYIARILSHISRCVSIQCRFSDSQITVPLELTPGQKLCCLDPKKRKKNVCPKCMSLNTLYFYSDTYSSKGKITWIYELHVGYTSVMVCVSRLFKFNYNYILNVIFHITSLYLFNFFFRLTDIVVAILFSVTVKKLLNRGVDKENAVYTMELYSITKKE